MVSLFSVSLSSGSVVKEYYDLFSGCKSDDPLSPDYIPIVFSHVTSCHHRSERKKWTKKFEKPAARNKEKTSGRGEKKESS